MATATTSLDRNVPGSAPIGVMHAIVLAAVWCTMALSGIVKLEPAPFEFLMVALMVVLPLFGLTRFSPQLLFLSCAWLLVAACGFVAALLSFDTPKSAVHTAITLYLAVACIIVAGFVLQNPIRHGRVIASGFVAAALISSSAGIIGYADLIPGTQELFTLHGRASGSFKDPNVLGAFLTPTFVLAFHLAVTGRGSARWYYVLALGTISLGLLLSFSRSAWLTAFASLLLYVYLMVLVAPTHRRRLRLMLISAFGILASMALLIGVMQIKSVNSLLNERASLSQTHDVGPEGRFGGQKKAVKLILGAPLGIGALEFSPRHHHEEPHNVWLAMFLNAGWIGGVTFLLLTVGTAVVGFRHVTVASPMQELYVVFYVGYIGTLMGGLVVDSDHWRHFYLLMGVLWGLIFARPVDYMNLPSSRFRFLTRRRPLPQLRGIPSDRTE